MQTPSRELETVARLLGALRAADGSVPRMRFVTEASRAMRDLPEVDRRVLARWLTQHGAPLAAERVVQLPTHGATSQARNEVARALLTLDRHEVDRFAVELRDPQRYRQLVAASLAAAQPPPPPPVAATRIAHRPPPPQPAAEVPPADTGPAAPARAVPPQPAAASERPAPEQPAPEPHRPATASERPTPITTMVPTRTPTLRRPPGTDDVADRLLHDGTPRQRLRRLEAVADGRPLTPTEARQVLAAVPDGWERRAALRRLVHAKRLDDGGTPADLVSLFARRSDRFAAAALLLRATASDVERLAAVVAPRDADRLRRRARR